MMQKVGCAVVPAAFGRARTLEMEETSKKRSSEFLVDEMEKQKGYREILVEMTKKGRRIVLGN